MCGMGEACGNTMLRKLIAAHNQQYKQRTVLCKTFKAATCRDLTETHCRDSWASFGSAMSEDLEIKKFLLYIESCIKNSVITVVASDHNVKNVSSKHIPVCHLLVRKWNPERSCRSERNIVQVFVDRNFLEDFFGLLDGTTSCIQFLFCTFG